MRIPCHSIGVRPHTDYVLDRPEVGVPRGMEPTGTNGRRANHFLVHPWRHFLSTAASIAWDGLLGRSAWSVASAFRSTCRDGMRPVDMRIVFLWRPWPRGDTQSPFRTWKLSPGTAMVLHSRGCGRVARRHSLSSWGRALRPAPFFRARGPAGWQDRRPGIRPSPRIAGPRHAPTSIACLCSLFIRLSLAFCFCLVL